jgi:Ni/Fe-hydrogenase subunit HybB-like protein
VDGTLKNSLIKTTQDIERFFRIGRGNVLRFVMIPCAIITGMAIGLFIGTGNTDIIEIFNALETRSIVKMVVLLTVFTGVLIPFSRFWYKKKFQHHFEELRHCLEEFEDNEKL